MNYYNVQMNWWAIQADTPEAAVEEFVRLIREDEVWVIVTDDSDGQDLGQFRLNGVAS